MDPEATILKVNEFVLPGDTIGRITTQSKFRLGSGLIQNKSDIVATKAGYLRFKNPNIYWIENNQMKYIPTVEDAVLGIVLEKHSENFKVDIGGSSPALLPVLAFEGVTKKNRPNLQRGSLLYARVVVANKDMDPELVCYAPNQKSQGFGEIKLGYMFKCSLSLARSLMAHQCPILQAIGDRLPFEIAVGVNGRVWVNTNNITNTVLIANAILNSEFLTGPQCQVLVQRMMDAHNFGAE